MSIEPKPDKIEIVPRSTHINTRFYLALTYYGKEGKEIRKLWHRTFHTKEQAQQEVWYIEKAYEMFDNPNVELPPYRRYPKNVARLQYEIQTYAPYDKKGLIGQMIYIAGFIGLCIWAFIIAIGWVKIYVPVLSILAIITGLIIGCKQIKREYFKMCHEAPFAEVGIILYICLAAFGLMSVVFEQRHGSDSALVEYSGEFVGTLGAIGILIGAPLTILILLLYIADCNSERNSIDYIFYLRERIKEGLKKQRAWLGRGSQSE